MIRANITKISSDDDLEFFDLDNFLYKVFQNIKFLFITLYLYLDQQSKSIAKKAS